MTSLQTVVARPRLVLAAAMLGIILVTIDVSVVNVAAPALGVAFRVKLTGLQWVLNVYTLAYASFLLNAGALSDRHGPRKTFLAGFFIFTLSSVACGVAPSFAFLITARLVQGFGAALLGPSALALLQLTFPDRRARAQAVGLWAGAGSFALAGGPIVGGALIGLFGWRSIFLINLPVGLAGLWLARNYAPDKAKEAGDPPDVMGQILGFGTVAAFTAALTETGARGWSDSLVLFGGMTGVALAVAFVMFEARSANPMVPRGIFNDRVFSLSTIIGSVINFSFYGLIFVLSLFFQQIQTRTPLSMGIAFVPMTAVLVAVNLFAGRFDAWLGLRRTLAAGLVIAGCGYLLLLPVGPSTPLLGFGPSFMLVGVGIAMATPATMAAALNSAGAGRSGIAGGVVNASRQAGGAVGVALFGSLIGTNHDFLSGMKTVIILASGSLFVAAVAALSTLPALQNDAMK